MVAKVGMEAVVHAIEVGQRFVVTSHVAQDGDNMSAQLALGMILRRLGKQVRIIDRDPVPARWKFLPEVERVEIKDVVTGPVDTALVVDTTRIQRTGLNWSAVRHGMSLVNIDHHKSNEFFGDINWVDPDAPASSSLIYHLAQRLNVAIDAALATCLFTGIMTDTGYFHFSGTTSETFRIAAELISCGASHVDLYRQVYDERPLAEVRLMGQALSELKVSDDQRIAWIEITPETLQRADAGFENLGPVVSNLCTIQGVDVGLTFEERSSERTLVEIRSRGRVDVGSIAKDLGGGGHHNASGCTLNVSIDQAKALVLGRVRQAVDTSLVC